MRVNKDRIFVLPGNEGKDIIMVKAMRGFNSEKQMRKYRKRHDLYSFDSWLDWMVKKELLEVLSDTRKLRGKENGPAT